MRTHKYRSYILEVCHCKHLLPEDIFEIIKKNHPNIGRATVYRNIEQMTKDGMLRKIPSVHGKTYYESNNEAHAHLSDATGRFFCDFPMDNISVKNLPEGYELAEICIYIKKS